MTAHNTAPLTLLAVHAHPDDEAFSTGGILAKYAAEGVRTVLVCATRGEVGEIHDPDVNAEEARERLGHIREDELRKACAILNVQKLHLLGYRDSGMVGTPENADPQNLHNADVDEVAEKLVHLIRSERPQVVITYNERGGYGHPDHIACHRATVAAIAQADDPTRYPEQGLTPWAVQKFYYTAFPISSFLQMRDLMRELGLPLPMDRADFDPTMFTVPDDQVTTRIDISAYLEQKRDALRMHRTQLGPDNPMLSIPAERAGTIMGQEALIRVFSQVESPLPEDDIFAGIRSVEAAIPV